MSLNEIREEIKRRQAMAEATHRRESSVTNPDVRAKECAWGKLVAYNRCLELLSQLKVD